MIASYHLKNSASLSVAPALLVQQNPRLHRLRHLRNTDKQGLFTKHSCATRRMFFQNLARVSQIHF